MCSFCARSARSCAAGTTRSPSCRPPTVSSLLATQCTRLTRSYRHQPPVYLLSAPGAHVLLVVAVTIVDAIPNTLRKLCALNIGGLCACLSRLAYDSERGRVRAQVQRDKVHNLGSRSAERGKSKPFCPHSNLHGSAQTLLSEARVCVDKLQTKEEVHYAYRRPSGMTCDLLTTTDQ